MKNLKISFNFDSTLDQKPMQELCTKYLKLGADVFVTTSRATKMRGGCTLHNDDLFQLTDFLGIKRENIIFTSFEDKYTFVKDFDLHYDDCELEIGLINDFPSKCLGFLYEHNFRQEQQQAKF